ncbi:MAG: glycosyltransferase [Ignavibacteriales bacterium]|nr:glycosyltransferase [Ignavibacteriales bacterium]
MENASPKISVIIPTLNEEKLLERTLAQFTDEIKNKFHLEIIVSDGGSTDETISIAKKYSSVVVLKENSLKENIAIGRNRGGKSANGKILVFLNADTLLKNVETFFQNIIFAIEQEDVVGVTCAVYVWPEEELFGDRLIHWCINNWFWFLNVIGIGMGRGECHIVKKEMFEQTNGYDETMPAGEDFDFFSRLRKKGVIAFLKKNVVYESPRRYRTSGYIRILSQWFLNAMWVFFLKKSYSRRWSPIR